MKKNIKIAKQLIRMAKVLVAQDKIEQQVNQIIDKKLNSNPDKAIEQLSEIIDDKEFDSFVKEVKSSCEKTKVLVSFKNDMTDNKIKQDVKQWTRFAEKLKNFCSGKPRYVLAAAAAVLFAYLNHEFSKVTWLQGLSSQSNSASINQFLTFLIFVSTYFVGVPGIFHMVNNICKRMGYEDLEDFKKEVQ